MATSDDQRRRVTGPRMVNGDAGWSWLAAAVTQLVVAVQRACCSIGTSCAVVLQRNGLVARRPCHEIKAAPDPRQEAFSSPTRRASAVPALADVPCPVLLQSCGTWNIRAHRRRSLQCPAPALSLRSRPLAFGSTLPLATRPSGHRRCKRWLAGEGSVEEQSSQGSHWRCFPRKCQ
jgi:hypothetical protein